MRSSRGPAPGVSTTGMARPIRILGIDPGLRRTGWGVIASEGNRLVFLACGSLATQDGAALASRLLAIHDGLRRVVDEHAPDEAAVEATFVNKDASATLKLGQARGIAVLLPKADPRTHDAADALALAVTHAHHRQSVLVRATVI